MRFPSLKLRTQHEARLLACLSELNRYTRKWKRAKSDKPTTD
jgi:hypothetical protein